MACHRSFDSWHYMRDLIRVCRMQYSHHLKLTSLLSGQPKVQKILSVAQFENTLGQLRQLFCAGACKITRREPESGKPGVE